MVTAKKKMVSVRLGEDLLEGIAASGESRSAFIERAVRAALGQPSGCAEEARPAAAAPVETARVQVPPPAADRALVDYRQAALDRQAKLNKAKGM